MGGAKGVHTEKDVNPKINGDAYKHCPASQCNGRYLMSEKGEKGAGKGEADKGGKEIRST